MSGEQILLFVMLFCMWLFSTVGAIAGAFDTVRIIRSYGVRENKISITLRVLLVAFCSGMLVFLHGVSNGH